jgi:RNA ligase (TIGR02306 family)
MEQELSTHRVEVVPFEVEKHPNADSLGIVNVFGGYTCCVRMDDWKDKEGNYPKTAAYVPPDSVVDVTHPSFTFLIEQAKDGKARIKAKKLRGIVSFGLLVQAPEGSQIGDNVAAQLCVEHYEPPIKGEGGGKKAFMGGEVASPPNVYTSKYDVDAFRRYHELFKKDEPVIVLEKLDGSNSRYVFHDGKMHCGSRTEWKKEYPSYDHVTRETLLANEVPEERITEILEKLHNKPKEQNMWWMILSRTPGLEKYCQDHPGHVVYGEAFGNIGRIKYGVENQFGGFDILVDGKWMEKAEALDVMCDYDIPTAPMVCTRPYDFDALCACAEGPSLVKDAKSIREGVVVTPYVGRFERAVGRLQLKCVSHEYLSRY